MEKIVAILTLAASGTAILITILNNIKSIREDLRSFYVEKVVIMVVGKCEIPPALMNVRNFTNYRKMMKAKDPIVIYHAKNLSWACAHADFVCANIQDDPKIFAPDDVIWYDLANDYNVLPSSAAANYQQIQMKRMKESMLEGDKSIVRGSRNRRSSTNSGLNESVTKTQTTSTNRRSRNVRK